MDSEFGNDGQGDKCSLDCTTYSTPRIWGKATSVPNIFSDAPRRFMKRETISVDRTLERTEKAVLEVKIAALQELNELLTNELNALRQQLEDLRNDRDKWREAHLAKPPVQVGIVPRRTTLWRLAG
jgi:hypothetical protein